MTPRTTDREAAIMTSTPAPSTGTEQAPPLPTPLTPGTITPDLTRALGMVGRVVTVPGLANQGRCLTVDGPDWHVVAGEDGTAHLFMTAGYIRAYETPVAEIKWDRPIMGLHLMAVDLPDLVRGVSLIKVSD